MGEVKVVFGNRTQLLPFFIATELPFSEIIGLGNVDSNHDWPIQSPVFLHGIASTRRLQHKFEGQI